jgi:hypothetical protein
MAIVTTMQVETFYCGADWPPIPMQLTPDNSLSGVPLAFYLFAATQNFGSEPIFTKSTANGGILTSGEGTSISTGLFVVQVTATDTASLTPSNYRWEVWQTGSGETNMLGRGIIPIAA